MVFESFGPELQKTVKKRFAEPTLVQKLGIPAIMSGDNVLIISPTGTGKSEVAWLPLFDKCVREKSKPISILYITPLRALNRDLSDRLRFWSEETGVRVDVRHGDTTQYERTKQSQMPGDMLITTPETLQAILTGSVMKRHLANVKFVVVDEVHELVNSKRGVQLTLALERLRALCGEPQIIGLSATVGNPEEVGRFLVGNGRDLKIVNAMSLKELDIKVESTEAGPGDAELASDLFIGIDTAARLRKISELIAQRKSVLIFTNTREFAEILSSRLKKITSSVETHHGSLSKSVRIAAEENFRKEKIKALVATSSLELGIDIGSIDLVVQYQSPRQVAKLVQRVGRSGHGVGRRSEGIIIATDADDCFESAVIARKSMAGEIEQPRIHKLAADVLAHQLVGLTIDKFEVSVDEAYELVKKSYAYADLTYEAFNRVVKQVQQLGLVASDGKTMKRRRLGWVYYFDNLSTISSVRQYKIFDTLTNQFVGTLDEEFVALHGQPGTTFVCKGQAWRIFDVAPDRVTVEPVEDIAAAIPAWEGELIPVPYDVAQEVGRLRVSAYSGYPTSESATRKMRAASTEQAKTFAINAGHMYLESFGEFVIIHTCLGSLVNETLGKALTALLSMRIGSVSLKTDPYRIVIRTQNCGAATVADTLKEIKPEILDRLLETSLPRTEMFAWRFLHNAKRFGAISKSAELGQIPLRRIIETYERTPIFDETMREILLEKMDVTRTKEILANIQSGKHRVILSDGLSFFGRAGLKNEFGEIVGPERPEQEILKIFKDRLLETRMRLVCANCGELVWLGRAGDAPDAPKCRKCGAKLVAVMRDYERNTEDAVAKAAKHKKLTDTEKRLADEAMKTADLVIVSGKRAILALAGRGVGGATAVRLLGKYYANDDDFFREVLNAERTFARTKRFWR